MASSKLALLNSYRTEEGKTPFADWRNARHQPMLDAYNAAAEVKQVEDAPVVIEEEVAHPGTPIVDAIKDAIDNNDFANQAIADAVKATKVPAYKTFANYSDSLVDKPVGFVHQFLTEHPDLTRKEAIFVLVNSYGVNYSTARTQYQKWFKARKG